MKKYTLRTFLPLVATSVILLALQGCGAVDHKLMLKDNYIPQTGMSVEVGKVTNETGQTYSDINLEQAMTGALTNKFSEKGLLSTMDNAKKITIDTKIVEYDQGDAFKRWLLPGWGATVLSVKCDLKEANQLIGSLDARRTVSAGGGYTVGAWRTIFGSLAEDIAEELQAKFPQVSPKSQ
jgi:hypothetical protein